MLMSAFFSITIVMKMLLVLIPMEAFHVIAMKDSMAMDKLAVQTSEIVEMVMSVTLMYNLVCKTSDIDEC